MHDYCVHDPKAKNRRGPIHELGVVMYQTNVGGRAQTHYANTSVDETFMESGRTIN